MRFQIRSTPGADELEQADELDREAAALGAGEEFMSFLNERSKEEASLTLEEMRRRRGM